MDDPIDENGLLDAAALVTDARATCPWCGETVAIVLDPAGGVAQEYVEDCEVCCRPWRVRVHYDERGVPMVSVEPAQ